MMKKPHLSSFLFSKPYQWMIVHDFFKTKHHDSACLSNTLFALNGIPNLRETKSYN